ncbi:GTPase family protein [Novipirellula artificiosorum]|uniref:tRNA modification GTPase TrmE n=1 Tax=Novipirellula artificiosorum TaxID=2528016 RepID=A0A5C6DC12_9BACT|nr:GTPase [Novipirellula artificiosorum]TWU34352.1 tRNA modification GTPase TrmE [Novipirellula artificiosorum]
MESRLKRLRKSLLPSISPRIAVLFLLWTLPLLCYVGMGLVAVYQTGWLKWIVATLPLFWISAWLVGKCWPRPRLNRVAAGKPLKAADFWTPTDTDAIAVVEQFRTEVDDVNSHTLADFNRFVSDARILAERLASHYHAGVGDNLLHPLTLVEILSVIHMAVEDLESWVLENVPGGDMATMGQLTQVPTFATHFDTAQKIVYVASAILNPTKLLAYPLWRKSGQVVVQLQNELVRSFYQRYLRQLGYYLIEMYSGRLRAGSKVYRSKFGAMASGIHVGGGDADAFLKLEDAETTIAVMGQVKAGKSSLINALTHDPLAATSVMPKTREVGRYQFSLPESTNQLTLLDTPGYSEADTSAAQAGEIRTAVVAADIVLLVLAANAPARQADVKMVQQFSEYYKTNKQLRPPKVIAVLTHIDLLRPVQEWDPPYDWRTPHRLKEESMAAAVEYTRELLGDSVDGYACVYTGNTHPADTSVVDEVIPQLVTHLDEAHAAAVLKAFYNQLGQKRLAQLSRQLVGLLKSVL